MNILGWEFNAYHRCKQTKPHMHAGYIACDARDTAGTVSLRKTCKIIYDEK